VGAASSAKVLATGSAWRLTGHAAAGRRLVRAVNRDDEDARAIAAMFLTRAGDRSVPLIREGLAAQTPSPVLLDVLAGIGTERARSQLRVVAEDGGDLAGAAREALRALDEIDRGQD
jgi:hypothetical protein